MCYDMKFKFGGSAGVKGCVHKRNGTPNYWGALGPRPLPIRAFASNLERNPQNWGALGTR